MNGIQKISNPPVAKSMTTPKMVKVVAQNLGLTDPKSVQPPTDDFVLTLMYNFGLVIEKK